MPALCGSGSLTSCPCSACPGAPEHAPNTPRSEAAARGSARAAAPAGHAPGPAQGPKRGQDLDRDRDPVQAAAATAAPDAPQLPSSTCLRPGQSQPGFLAGQRSRVSRFKFEDFSSREQSVSISPSLLKRRVCSSPSTASCGELRVVPRRLEKGEREGNTSRECSG